MQRVLKVEMVLFFNFVLLYMCRFLSSHAVDDYAQLLLFLSFLFFLPPSPLPFSFSLLSFAFYLSLRLMHLWQQICSHPSHWTALRGAPLSC